jgi:hypothetical protein
MSATYAPRASIARRHRSASPRRETPVTVQTGAREAQGVAFNRDQVGAARLLLADVRSTSLLLQEARKRSVTRVFGVPREDQSFLVTMILIGAVAGVLRDFVARPWPRPSGADAATGGLLLNETLRGIAGAPSRNMPLTGALIAFGLLSHSLRPAVAGSAREIQALAREVRAGYGARYRH